MFNRETFKPSGFPCVFRMKGPFIYYWK